MVRIGIGLLRWTSQIRKQKSTGEDVETANDNKEQLRDRITALEGLLETSHTDAERNACKCNRLEEALRLHERALENTSEGIAILDVQAPDNPLVYVNAGFERQTGYQREEVLDKSVRFIHGQNTDPKTVLAIRSALEEGREYTTEILSCRKDGTAYWNRLALTPLKDTTGAITHFVSIQSDVTQRVESNEDVRQALELLEKTNRKLTSTNKAMKRNLDAAAKIQHALLPERMPKAENVRFAWRFRPCEALAGDILNVFRLDDNHIGLYLLDVTGHGTAAALLAVTLSRLLTPHSLRPSLVREWDQRKQEYFVLPPAEVADRLNRQFPWNPETGQFFTLIYAVLNKNTFEFRYTAAGHPGPAHCSGECAPIVENSDGLPVGLAPEAYTEQVIQLQPGDRLYLYSDGVTEVMNEERTIFGIDRVLAHFEGDCGTPLDQCLDDLIDALGSWNARPAFEDDLSLLALEIKRDIK